MATIALTKETFETEFEKGGTLIVDFWAPWCPPCRAFAPVYEQASERHAGVTFAKVNTEEQQELAVGFRIESIPTIMVFRDKILLFNESGALPPPALEQLLTEVQKLDMDDVRKKIASAGAEPKDRAGAAPEGPAS